MKTYITPFYQITSYFLQTQRGGVTQLRRWAKLWRVGSSNKSGGGVGRRCAKNVFKTCLKNKYLTAFLVVILGHKVHYETRYLLWQRRLRFFNNVGSIHTF